MNAENTSKLERFTNTIKNNKLATGIILGFTGLAAWGITGIVNAEYETKAYKYVTHKPVSNESYSLGHNPMIGIHMVTENGEQKEFPFPDQLQYRMVEPGDSIYVDVATNTLLPITRPGSLKIVNF